MASIFEEEVSDTDEDMIACHVCLMRFNLTDRKPKSLDCHHYFCVSCIQAFSKVNSIPCPTCRKSTNMTGRQIEELATNNVVLRLMTIATDRARELAQRGKKRKAKTNDIKEVKEWCIDCSFLACDGCHKDNHQIQNYHHFYQDRYWLLTSIIESLCDESQHYQEIQSVQKTISHKMKLFHRVLKTASDAIIVELEDSLKSNQDVDFSPQEDNVINKINHLITEFSEFRDKSDKFNAIKSKALHILQSFEKNLDAINMLLKDDETEKK